MACQLYGKFKNLEGEEKEGVRDTMNLGRGDENAMGWGERGCGILSILGEGRVWDKSNIACFLEKRY